MRIFGVDIDDHIKKLEETDQLSATLMKELVLKHDRLMAHIGVVSEQCQGYKDDADNLQKILIEMKGRMNVE